MKTRPSPRLSKNAGRRFAGLLEELQKLFANSRFHQAEPINVIAHSHGTAITASALSSTSVRLSTVIFAGSDLNPYFPLGGILGKADRVYSLNSPDDLITGSIGAAGNFGFYTQAPNFNQIALKGVRHFRTPIGEQHGIQAYMTSEIARQYFAQETGAAAGISAGARLRGESSEWVWLYQDLISRYRFTGSSGR